jgi:uncharacterized protein (DUF1800 family)
MRKTFAISALIAAAACGVQSGPPGSTVAPPAVPNVVSAAATRGDLLPDERIQQVLNRLTFGARPGDAEKLRSMGIDAWVNQQLHPETIADPRVDSLMTHYSAFAMAQPDIIHDYNLVQQVQRQVKSLDAKDTTMNRAEARRDVLAQDPKLAETIRKSQQFVGEVQSSELARAVVSDRQLEEVMTQFWLNHFSVFAGKGQVRLFLTNYDRDVIRPRALGKFRDLLEATAKSPAMLFFLDNFQSQSDSTHRTLTQARNAGRGGRGGRALPARPAQAARRPGLNENYARELMELHTLGVDGGYSQKDVQEVARALTGWTFSRQTGEFVFNPNVHDADAKTILGHTLPAGRGIEDGEQVLDIVSRSPATAHFITLKLARHFVRDDPPAALVDRCANTFSQTDGDIRETLRCIIASPEFFSKAAYRAKVKTPFELVASALRAVNAQPDTTQRTAALVTRLGQPIFGRQTPDGWPDRGDAWMNTGAILNRINFGLQIAAGQIPGARIQNVPELFALRTQPREQQVDAVVKSMLGGQVSSVTRQVLVSGNNPMLSKSPADATDSMAATQMGRGAGAGPAGRAAALGLGRGMAPPAQTRPIDLTGLPQVVGLALGAPEFQRR